MSLVWAVTAAVFVSLISLIGVISLILNDKLLKRILVVLVGFATGGLIGGAFLHLLPEALEYTKAEIVFAYAILGFGFFFILERYFHWRHCHDDACDIHAFAYLNLIGDALHNLTDGLVIGVSFSLGLNFGIITTLIIIFHEIPQEIGDFGILVYAGIHKYKALFYNLLCSLTCIVGAILGNLLISLVNNFSACLLPFTAGGFIYIASCDLVPELHKQNNTKRANAAMFAFVLGVLFMWLVKMIFS